MNATFHWNAFAARLQAVGSRNPHITITGNQPELEAIDSAPSSGPCKRNAWPPSGR
jgi:hypothetical protein